MLFVEGVTLVIPLLVIPLPDTEDLLRRAQEAGIRRAVGLQRRMGGARLGSSLNGCCPIPSRTTARKARPVDDRARIATVR
jgi:hypothetical protein